MARNEIGREFNTNLMMARFTIEAEGWTIDQENDNYRKFGRTGWMVRSMSDGTFEVRREGSSDYRPARTLQGAKEYAEMCNRAGDFI